MKHAYNKLVRDKIPEIIEESGRHCEYEILSDDASIKNALIDKLKEKADAFAHKPTEDELSDLYEVLTAIVKQYDFEPMHIDYLKMQNNEQKGTYSGNTFLISVDDD
ncbi:MAG: nucleoside triphosphate pyrophosphohydrolase [Eubacteriaceae bacterium]|jgi:predicted house-cleaning noncanonical NTP pyrophosphatase (MazG superfamily)|nr:nucleoside triphosphate pyrophosphohydrolase [Eubacteriaceae bacterium]MDD4507887.1 nucleoside triphosphate pyrophosphohydrolase [Eubacteriaceae bacterium]